MFTGTVRLLRIPTGAIAAAMLSAWLAGIVRVRVRACACCVLGILILILFCQ